MPKTVAVAMIVKNEEALLERCLSSVRDADAIYIADTGSVDRTLEIARQFTNNVYLDYVWCDSMSGARNFIKSKVKEDFILSIDADEVLGCSFDEVRKAVELAKDHVRVFMHSEFSKQEGGKIDFLFNRLFRNSPDIYWVGRIHNHLNLPGSGEPVGNVSIIFGHSPAHNIDPNRALRILEQVVAEDGRPRDMYYLGREYWYKQRFQEAVDTLARYIEVSDDHGEVADAHLIKAQCHAALGQAEECGQAALQAVLVNSDFKEAIEYLAGIVLPHNRTQWLRMARSASNEGVVWKRVDTERTDDVLAICPHQDDEALFLSYTLLRERPLVVSVTDSHIQPMRGDVGCAPEIRRQETIEAMKIAGCPVVFMGIPDTQLTEDILRERLRHFNPARVYIPAIQGGNVHHDMVGKIGLELFGDRCVQYTTYTKTELYTTGRIEVKPTQDEVEMKWKMLNCYRSQLDLQSTYPHFQAVFNKSEWFL